MPAPRRRSYRLLATSALSAIALAALWAAPAHAQLVQGATPAQSNGGAPTINQAGNTTTVTMGAGATRTVIDWDKFDIDSGDTADFVFANRSDIVLNRVGGAGSTINGNLNGTIGAGGSAGGNIWIYNANGVVIGANARISTGGLLVTTAAVDRATDSSAGGFLDGGSTQFGFTGAGTGNITVQNGAQITSHGGAIALVAPVVTTEAGSSISAQDGGNVLVGSASRYQISFRPTSTDDMDLLSFEVADGAGTSGTDAINLAGDISGNRVFVAAVSKSGLVASIMSTGTISANTVATDESGAIVLSANHDIVNGAAAAAPLSNIGAGYVTTYGGAVTGPKVDFVASENVLLRGDVGEAGATVNLHSDNTDIKQYAGVITADTLTASAHTGINFNSFDVNKVDTLGALSTDTGDLAYLGDEDGVILTGAISAPGKVTLGARGFMDTTTGSITAGSLELSLGGGGSFKVNGDANIGYGQSQGAVTIQATGGITLSNEFGMLLGDQLSLTADNGAIRETGGFISGGGAVVANANGEIDLGGANSFTSVTANSTDGERVTVNATGNLDFKVNTFSGARFTVGGDATSSGTNALISGGLFVTAGGAINLSSDGGYTEFGDLSAGGNITLAMDGNLVLGGVIQAGGALSLTSRGGAIRQTSGTISLGTSFTFNAATGIDLNQTGNHLGDQSLVSMATGGTGSDVTIRGDAMKLYLHGALGDVSLYGESGDVVVGPGLTASSLTAEAARDIQVGSNGNTVAVDTYHRLIGTNVSVYNNGDFTVDGDVGRADVGQVELVAPNGTLTQAAGTIFGADISLRATYAINQDSGASVQQGSNSIFWALAGTDLQLTGANRFGLFPYLSWGANANVTIRSVGGLDVDTSNFNLALVPVHALKLISDEGYVAVYSGFTADTLNVQAHGDITLDDGYSVNKIGSVTGLTSATGNISLREDDGFTIDGDISAAAGNITLKSDGAIEANSGTLSLGGTLAVTAGGGASLTGAGAIKLGAVSTSGGGNFYLGSDGNIDLTGAINTGTGSLILSTTNGAITSNGGTISAWSTTADATGAITLVGSGFANFWATSSGGGDIHLSSDNDLGFAANTTGALTVETTGQAYNSGDVVAHSVAISAGTGIGLINTGYTVDIGSFSHLATDDGLVSVDIQGDIKLDGDVTAGGTGNTVSLTSGQNILQNSGTITGDNIELSSGPGINANITQASGATLHGGALSLTSGGNATLGQANDFTSIATLNIGRNLTLRNLGSIDLDATVSGGFTGGGALDLTSDTGDVTAGNDVNAVKLTASAVNGSILLGGAGNMINSLGTLTAGGDIEIGTSAAGFNLTGDITATNLTLLVPNGGITQSDGTKITAGTLTANANNIITLDQANAVTTVVGLNANLFTAGHSITFRNDGSITLGGVVDATGATLRLTSNTGGISQNSGAGIYVRADQLFLSGASDLLLNSTSNNIATLGGASSTDGGILYRDADGFDIAGNITATSGGASLRTAGAGTITQSGGIIDVDYLGAITIGGGSVTLNQANRIHRLIATSGNGTLSINSTTDVLIDQSVYFDTISLSSGGSITQSNTGSLGAGTANLSAVTGINLPGASFVGNNGILNLGTITNTTSGGINIVSYSGSHTSLTGDISAAGQTVSISDVAGYILQTGGVITADTLSMSATGGINVGGANQVANLGAMTGPGVTFANAGSFNVTQSIGVSAGIYLTSNSGAITQNAGTTLTADTIGLTAGTTINQGAGATLHTANLSLTSGGNATLGEANDFTTLTDLAVGGDLTLRNLGNINLSPILGGTGGYRSGGALTLVSDTGNIFSTNSGIDTSRLTVSAAGSITLDGRIPSLGTITAGQSILLTTYNGSMELTGNITGRSISLYGNSGLNQTGGIIDADRLNVITNGDISLTGANQIDVVGRLDTDQFDSGTGHDIMLHNVGAIVLDYQIEAPDGTVTLTSDTGGISQTIFSSLFVARALNASAAGDIVLDYAGNNVGRVTGLQTSSGNITFNEANGFDIYGNITTPGGVSFGAGGAIETYTGHLSADTLAVTAGGEVSLNATGDIKLGGVGVNSGFTLTADGSIELTGNLTAIGASLVATAGTITQSAGALNLTTGSFVANGSITLAGDNRIASTFSGTSNGGGAITYNDGGSAGIVVALNTTGNAVLTLGGNLASGGITAGSLSVDAGHIDLTNSVDVNSFTRLVAAYGDVLVTNNGSFTVAGDVSASKAGLRSVNLWANGGGISQTAGTISANDVTLRGTGDMTQSGTGRIDANVTALTGANLDLMGDNSFGAAAPTVVSAGGTVRLNGDALYLQFMDPAGDVTLTAAGGITIDNFGLQASSLTAAAGDQFTATSGNQVATVHGLSGTSVTFTNEGGFAIDGDVTADYAALTANNGGISQTAGTISALNVSLQGSSITQSGTANIVAPATLTLVSTGNILLGGANDFGTPFLYRSGGAGSDVTLRNAGSIDYGDATAIGALTLISDTGAISQTVAIGAISLTASAAQGITLTDAGNAVGSIAGLGNSGANGIAFTNSGNFTLDGSVSAAGQTVSLRSAGGSIRQNSGGIIAGTLNAYAGQAGVTLFKDNSVAALGTIVADDGGDIFFRNFGDVALTGNMTTTGHVTLLSALGAIGQTGGIITAGAIEAFSANGIDLGQANDIDAITQLSTSGDILFRNSGDIAAPAISTGGTLHLISDTGTITQTGVLAAGTLIADAQGDVTLTLANQVTDLGGLASTQGGVHFSDSDGFNVTGDVQTRFDGSSLAQAVYLDGGSGDIVQTGGGISSLALFVDTSGDALFDGSANHLLGLGDVTVGGDFTLRTQEGLRLFRAVDVTGTARLTSVTGTLSEDVGFGTIAADTLYLSAASGIDFDEAGNSAARASLVTAAGDIAYATLGSNLDILALSAPGTATLTANDITQSGAIDIGTLNATAQSVALTDSGNQIGAVGNVTTTTGIGFASIVDADGFDVTGTLNASSSITLGTGGTGSIRQTGGSTITALVLGLSAGGDIVLDGANAVGTYDVSLVGGDTVTLRNAGALSLAGIDAPDAAVTLTSDTGGIGFDGGTGTITAASLTATAATTIDLFRSNAVASLGALTAHGTIAFKNDGDFDLAGAIDTNGNALTLYSDNGAITQRTGSILHASTLDVQARNAITLDQANDIGTASGSNFLSQGDVAFRSTGGILFHGGTALGTLRLTADNGDIRTDADVHAARLEASASGDIVLDNVNNALATIGDVHAGGSFTVYSANDLQLDGDIDAPDHVTLVSANGDVTQVGTGIITTDLLDVTAAGAMGIALLNANDVGTAGFDANGNDVHFRNLGDIAIGGISAAGHIVELVSDNGDITQQAATALTAGTLIADAANGNVDFSGLSNAIARVERITAGGTVNLTIGSGDLQIDEIDAQAADIDSLGGGVTGGNINVGRLGVSATGAVALNTASNVDVLSLLQSSTGDVSFTNTGDFQILSAGGGGTGNVTLQSLQGGIGMAGGGEVDASSLTAYGLTGVTLTGAIDSIASLSAGAGADVGIDSTHALDVAGDITARGVTLRSDAGGGAITQSGGVVTADLLTASATGQLTLTGGNAIAALGNLTSTGGDIAVTSIVALDLTGLVQASSGTVSLDASSLGESGGHIQAFGLTAHATDVLVLDEANQISSAGEIRLYSDNSDIAYNGVGSYLVYEASTPGTLTLTAGGAITQGAGSITASAVDAHATASVTLDGISNAIGSVAHLESDLGSISFASGTGYTIDGDVHAAWNVSLVSGGSIDQIDGTIAASMLDVSATAAGSSVTLGQANAVGALGSIAVDSDLVFQNAGGLGLAGDIDAATVTLGSANGGIDQSAGRIATGTLSASAAGDLGFGAGTNAVANIGDLASVAGDITFATQSDVLSGNSISGGHVTLGIGSIAMSGGLNADLLTVTSPGNVALTGDNRIASLGDISGDSIQIAVGEADITGTIQAATSLRFSAAGTTAIFALTDSGTGHIVAPSLTLDAGGVSGDTMLDGDNDVAALSLNLAGGATFNAIGDLALSGTVALNGDLSLTSGGRIASTGVTGGVDGTITAHARTGIDIAFASGDVGAFGDQITDAGDVSLMAANVRMTGTVSASGAFRADATSGSVTQAAGATITASVASGSATNGDMLLDGDNSVGMAGALFADGNLIFKSVTGFQIVGLVNAGAGANLTLIAGGDVSISGLGSLSGGTLNVTAPGHVVDLAGQISSFNALGDMSADAFTMTNGGDLDLVGTVTGGRIELSGDRITQSGGSITADLLGLSGSGGFALDQENHVGALSVTSATSDPISFTNAQELALSGDLTSFGDVSLTIAGKLDAAGSSISGANVTLSTQGLDLATLAGTGSVSLDAGAGDMTLAGATAGDDLSLATLGNLTVGAIQMDGLADAAGDGFNVLLSGNDVVLGAAIGPASAGNALNYATGVTPGTVDLYAAGNATLRLDSMNAAASITAGGDILALLDADLLLAHVMAANVTLKAGGAVHATSIDTMGDYSVTGADIDAGALTLLSTARDVSIADVDGDLTLTTEIAAGRNLTVTASGSILGSGASLGAGVNEIGALSVTAANIALHDVGSLGDIILDAGSGDVDLASVFVAGSYTLTGNSFSAGALQPGGPRTGLWTLSAGDDLDLAGLALDYDGGIAFDVTGALSGGDLSSVAGTITGTALSTDLGNVGANGDVGIATTGELHVFHIGSDAGAITLSGDSIRVFGDLAAAGNISASAPGDVEIGYATAGGDIAVTSTGGDAKLRQANLTGATGDLLIQADTGSAVLGEDDAFAGIGTDRWFERAAGSTGIATVTGGNGAYVNLDHSAVLDSVGAEDVSIDVATGDLSIGQLMAGTYDALVYVENGSLTIGSASAAGDLDLEADGGNLTVLGGASGFDTYLTTDGLLDTTAATITGTGYLELTADEIRAASLESGGDIDAYSISGAIGADSVRSTGGNAIFSAYGDLNLGSVVANGGQLGAGGNATVRSITAPDGFALIALGDVTLGADTPGDITAGNILSTGGSLGGCGCGSGGATLVSIDGSTTVNLFSVTGVFDVIASAEDGDVAIRVQTGDLGIGDLAGHDIGVTLPGGTLTAMNPVSSGGDYRLTAQDFAGNALDPIFDGHATALGDVEIHDTLGNLAAGGTLAAAGDILVDSVGSITGTLSLQAAGDVEVTASAIRLGDVAGRDVTLDAGLGTVDMVGTLTIGRSYQASGGAFSGNALAPVGTRLGDVTVLDRAGDFTYANLDLGFAGLATLTASDGAFQGGDISTLGDLSIQGTGVTTGTLRSDDGGVTVDSDTGIDVAGIEANDAIHARADGDLHLGSAALSGTGINSLSLSAGGDLVFGAADAVSIGAGNVFTSAGTSMSGSGVHAEGDIAINLDHAAQLTGIGGGTLQLAVQGGDLVIGNIETAGAISITGPTGTLTLGDVETDAGHIAIAGQGGVTTGAVSGHFVVDIGSSAGSLAFNRVTGGDVTLGAAGGITGTGPDAGVFADSLALTAGGDVDLATAGTGSRIASLGAITVTNGGFALRNLQDLDLDGTLDVQDGTVDFRLGGGLAQNSGAILAERLTGSFTGNVSLGGTNRIGALGELITHGLLVNNEGALSIDGVIDDSTGGVTIRSVGGGLTITANGQVVTTATGDAIVLASDGRFVNQAGATALDAGTGRWLVYTQATGNADASDPGNDFGGLGGASYYGAAYDFAAGSFAAAPNAGNRFVYGYRPVLSVTPDSLHLTYDGSVPVLTAGITGLVNGDQAADAWSGAPALGGASRNAGTYTVNASLGTLASDMNYAFAFGSGILVIDPRMITAALVADSRTYNGTTDATGNLALSGVLGSDDVGVTSASLSFDNRNAGVGHVVTAGGIALSGADAGNYTVNATATDLADIFARMISATLTANGRTYDGTTDATGTLSLTGVLGSDDVGVASAGISFDNRNAGTGHIVTASGIALTGADAGNYVVNGSATALADILARAITVTLTADSRTYDGTTDATGTLALAGVLGSDQVGVGGTLAFDNRNAGTGHTVTASGIALTGADAGNYVVNGSATALADILARAITATLTADSRTYDGTTGATGNLALTGVLGSDDVGVTSAGISFDNRNAGIGHTVTASGVSLTGADASNYVVNGSATALADILARAITATLTADSRTYDGTIDATGNLALTGVLGSDDVAVTNGGLAFDNRNAGVGHTVTASGVSLTGADAGNYVVNGSATALADILARAITATLTADSRTYDGTTGATGNLALAGVLGSDQVSVGGNLAFDNRNAGVGHMVTASGIALTGADAGNYTVNTIATDLADILARAITATLTADSRTYDGTTDATGNLALSGVLGSDDVGVTSADISFDNRNAGVGHTVTANGVALTGADAGNYTVNATATDLADIFARMISAALTANGRTYDGTTDATGTLSLTGVLGSDDVGVTSTGLSFDNRNAGVGHTVTASGVSLTGADAGNYVVDSSANALADILARAITVTLTADSRTYDGTTGATGNLALTGVLGSDQVSVGGNLAFDNRNAGTGHVVTASGIALTGADAGNYTVNATATALADILARAITATLTANDRTYDGTTDATGNLALTGVIAGDDVGVTNGGLAFDNRNAGIGHTVTASGIALTGADAGNYVVNGSATALADILARAITATLTADSRTYDGATDATGNLTLSGVLGSDQVGVGGNLAFDNRNAGIGHTVIASGVTLTGADAGNYTVNPTATALADILARAITATLTANDRTYDGTTDATGSLVLAGVLGSDQVGVGGNLAFDNRNAGIGHTVTASGIALTGADAGNYTVNTIATALADILARAITATLAANGRTYDGTTDATGNLALSGVLGSDDVGVTSAGISFDNRNAGTGHTVIASGVTLTGADAGNYTVNAIATDLADILARTITATLTADSRTYDGTTGATGNLALTGVLGSDQVGVSGNLAFDNRNAGTGHTVTASGVTLTGADAGNYTVNPTATALADILARAVTATLTANDRTYDGTTDATGTLALNGVVAGDDIGVTNGGLTFDNRNAGVGHVVTASGIALSGADAGNYTVNATATDLADIFARMITATLTANGRTYDGTTDATGTLSLTGVLGSDDVGVASAGISFDNRNAGIGHTVTASGVSLTGADASNYVVNGSATALADILARAITATLTADSRTYDGTIDATGNLALTGVLGSDDVAVTNGGLAFDNRNAGVGHTVTASGVSLTGADAGNYVVNGSATALADILARAITATLTADSRTYDGTTGATGNLALTGVLGSDQVGVSGNLAFDNRNAGTGHTVTASGIALTGADAGNYVVNGSATALADILARAITVTLTANDRTYDGTTGATGSLSLSGVVAGDDIGVTSAGLSFDNRNAGVGHVVTASGIALSGADAGNYTVNATATALADILARAITATLTANGRTYDGTTDATGALSLSGVLGGDNVGVTSTGLAFDNRDAGVGHIVTASGITLSGADAGNYTVNATATDLADILARAITATLTADSRTYDGTTDATGNLALTGVLGSDQVGVGGSLAFDNRNAGVGHMVTASGITLSGADAGNYTVNAAATALADILARAITATLTANDRTYDGTTDATGTLGLTGVIAGDDVGITNGGLAFDSRNAGAGRIVTASGIALTGADAGNYTVNATTTDLADILARAITVTLTADSRTYDGTTNATGNLALTGVLAGDTVSVGAGRITFDSRDAGDRTVTAYGLTLGGADAANYTIGGTATDVATIARAALTATATADSRTYDGTTATTGHIALSGVISGDTVTGTASYRFADANAGTGRSVQVSGLALTGADAGNYTVTLAANPVTADILRRAVTVTIGSTIKILGQPDPVFGYTVSNGMLVAGDNFTGAIARDPGEQIGTYAIGQGTLALSANYLLTVIPGSLTIGFVQSGAEGNDALKSLRVGHGFSTDEDPSANLEGDGNEKRDGDK